MEASALPVDTGICAAPGAPRSCCACAATSSSSRCSAPATRRPSASSTTASRPALLAYVRRMLPPARARTPRTCCRTSRTRCRTSPARLQRAARRWRPSRAWLYRVAHNRCIDELRRPGAAADGDRRAGGRPAPATPRSPPSGASTCAASSTDLGRLPEQQRSALLMRELEGFSYEELGAALGVTQPAVKSLLVRARIGLAEAAQARDTACDDIREDLARRRATAACARAPARGATCATAATAAASTRRCASTSRDLGGSLLPGPPACSRCSPACSAAARAPVAAPPASRAAAAAASRAAGSPPRRRGGRGDGHEGRRRRLLRRGDRGRRGARP